MTPEEYIKSIGNTVINGKTIIECSSVLKCQALAAIALARKEEREKAINAFTKAIDGYMIICGVDYSPKLLSKFKELLK